MRAVKSKNTRPELVVRRLLHRAGYRYRLHRKDLPGTPDLLFPRFRGAIFVNGCFWHGHDCRLGRRVPKTNVDFWRQKIAGNVARDEKTAEALAAVGWRVATVWECELSDLSSVKDRLVAFLETGR